MIDRNAAFSALVAALVLVAGSTAAQVPPEGHGGAPSPPPPRPEFAAVIPPYEAINADPFGTYPGDHLAEARHIAAIVLAQDKPQPQMITDVGSYSGEFLEAFLQRFPAAHGQWTEPVPTNENNARKRLSRFGDHVSYVIGCASRDISQGCVPKGTDVLLTSWLQIHQDRPGIARWYAEAFGLLPRGGWVVVLDHVGSGGDAWETRLSAAHAEANTQEITIRNEGPPIHHPGWTVPSLDEQLADMRAAGFEQPQVVWRRLDTVVMMARKP
jgi:hypothetical protein